MSAPESPPAFPVSWTERNEYDVQFTYTNPGMSLRDWFAGKAPIAWADARQVCGWDQDSDFNDDGNRAVLFAVMAGLRYEYADAMLAERAK